MADLNSIESMIIRIDERVNTIIDHIEKEVKPLLRDSIRIAETVRWLKIGVLGIYGLFGTALSALATYVYLH
jgi:hypothetical protein